jgi:protein phosphatase PTC6
MVLCGDVFREYMNSDARVLLCGTNDGVVHPMTENHHPDTLIEATRLRRMMGSSLITDSFGESR